MIGRGLLENPGLVGEIKGNPPADKARLRPVFDKSRVSYIPVENHQVKLRELFTREEAEALQGTEEMKKDEKLRQAVEYVLGKKKPGVWC
mgnify:CR=1 FL=1